MGTITIVVFFTYFLFTLLVESFNDDQRFLSYSILIKINYIMFIIIITLIFFTLTH